MAERRPRVDAVRRDEQLRVDGEVRRREAERAAARVAGDHGPLHLGRTPEQRGGRRQVAREQPLPDLRGRDALDGGNGPGPETQPSEQVEVAAASPAEPEVGAREDDLGADRPQDALRELLGLERRELEVEADDERLLHAQLRQQLEPPGERADQQHLVPEGGARVRVERDDGRGRPRGERLLDDPAVAAVNAVEGADRDRPRARLELPRGVDDLHGRRASASSTGMIRSSSASSTRNGPTAVRLSETQWPPSTSAIARTYVPEPTARSRVATPSA